MRGFFSVNLDAYTEALNRIDVPIRDGMRRAQKPHITLMFCPDISESVVRSVVTGLRSPPFWLRGDSVMAYPSQEDPDLYALCFEDERELHRLRGTLESYAPEHTGEYRLHVTLAGKTDPHSNFQEGRSLVEKVESVDIFVDTVHFVASAPERGMHSYENRFEVRLVA